MKTTANWKLLIIALAVTVPLPFIVSQGCGSDPYTTPVPPAGAPILINDDVPTTKKLEVLLRLFAEDTDGVTAYFVSENGTTPAADAAGWVTITPVVTYTATVSFTLSMGLGVKTVYVWYKDMFDNISDRASDSIEFVEIY